MRLHIVLLASFVTLSLALAGCSGGDDGTPSSSTSSSGTSTQTGTSTGTSTGGGTSYAWSNTSVSGSFISLRDPIDDSLQVNGEYTFSFDATADTARVEIRMTATGNNAELLIAPPGCDPTLNDCETRVDLPINQEVVWSRASPATGTWNARLFGSDVGLNQVGWDGTVGLLQPA